MYDVDERQPSFCWHTWVNVESAVDTTANWCHLKSFAGKPIKIGNFSRRNGRFWLAPEPPPSGSSACTGGTAGCGNQGAADRRVDEQSHSAGMSMSAFECCSASFSPSDRQPIPPCLVDVLVHDVPALLGTIGAKLLQLVSDVLPLVWRSGTLTTRFRGRSARAAGCRLDGMGDTS